MEDYMETDGYRSAWGLRIQGNPRPWLGFSDENFRFGVYGLDMIRVHGLWHFVGHGVGPCWESHY